MDGNTVDRSWKLTCFSQVGKSFDICIIKLLFFFLLFILLISISFAIIIFSIVFSIITDVFFVEIVAIIPVLKMIVNTLFLFA